MIDIQYPVQLSFTMYDLEGDAQSVSFQITAIVKQGMISFTIYYFDSVALILMCMNFKILKSNGSHWGPVADS